MKMAKWNLIRQIMKCKIMISFIILQKNVSDHGRLGP